MDKKIIAGLGALLFIAVLAPTMAISQDEPNEFCDNVHQLRRDSVSALFERFQGLDDMETATSLLRQTLPNGQLQPQISARFDAASMSLAADKTHIARQEKLAFWQTDPRIHSCASLQDSLFMQP